MPEFDLLIRGGRVVDGTRAPGGMHDIGVSGSRIVAMGEELTGSATDVVDACGMVVAPGFIDIHTHYDAQVLWDQDLTPSSWHGITTVILGNCGFSLAPTRPEHRSLMLETMERVEDMSRNALDAGVAWDFETFPDYLDHIERAGTRLNLGVFVGHTAVRTYVMGEEASQRAATPAELDEMRQVVDEAMESGGIGFATSNSLGHFGAHGLPVPSRLASLDEILHLVGALERFDHGVIEITQGPEIYLEEFGKLVEVSGKPLTWTSLLTGRTAESSMDILNKSRGVSEKVFPQVSCRPLVFQFRFTSPQHLNFLPAFQSLLDRSFDERVAAYRSADWREEASRQVREQWAQGWAKTTIAETNLHRDMLGMNIGDLARESGRDPLDIALDLALAEGLDTRFRTVVMNDDEEELSKLLNDDRTILGLSDAGAHLSQLCDACFSTHLLRHWVYERGTLSLEDAIWRLSGQPADVYGLLDRGRLAVGAMADIVILDPATVGTGPLERVYDLPGGADRLIARGEGIRDVWINGAPSRRDGEDLDHARSGWVLRGGVVRA